MDSSDLIHLLNAAHCVLHCAGTSMYLFMYPYNIYSPILPAVHDVPIGITPSSLDAKSNRSRSIQRAVSQSLFFSIEECEWQGVHNVRPEI